MGQMQHMDKEYFQEFDPEKFAAQIKAQAAEESEREAQDKQADQPDESDR